MSKNIQPVLKEILVIGILQVTLTKFKQVQWNSNLKPSIYQNLPITKTLKHDFPLLCQTLLVMSPLTKITTCTTSDFFKPIWRLRKIRFLLCY